MCVQDMREALLAGGPAPTITLQQLYQLAQADAKLAEHFAGLLGEVQDSLQTEPEGRAIATPAPPPKFVAARPIDGADIREADGRPVACVSAIPFENWGRTVSNVPAVTYVPTTKAGVCSIVQWAGQTGQRVRVAGYRHTWTDLYSQSDQVLISLLPLDVVNNLPAQEPPIDPANELQGITITGYVEDQGVQKALCRIGAATTNEQFRQWCLSSEGGNREWTLPLNVIMVEITFGGSNGPICHGAGWRNETLSDLVTEVEFVNVLGQLQIVNDPQILKAAAGAFGLLGVVTAVTLKLDPMTFAALLPAKTRLALAVPPPDGYPVPAGVDMSGITPQELADATTEFVSRCENSYYAEWFWFTFQENAWINTWNNDGVREQAIDYPSPLETSAQELQEYLAGLLVGSDFFNRLPEYYQASMLATSAMTFLPTASVTTFLIDALHFRRGIQNMRVLDMEFEIPIPAAAGNPSQPDWSICQRAWWDAVTAVYETYQQSFKVPMRLTLEMRIMGGSGITMAPQYGNQFGTCSIEVLTTINTDRDDWAEFMQGVANFWSQYTDSSGSPLNIRPHWAKQWQGLTMGGMPIEDYLPTVAYPDRLPEFAQGLSAVAEAGGYTLGDMQARFSNILLDQIFASVFSPPP